MDNFNTTDMENYAKKIDEKYADRDADKMGYQEFNSRNLHSYDCYSNRQHYKRFDQ